jgi:hypothetical protein
VSFATSWGCMFNVAVRVCFSLRDSIYTIGFRPFAECLGHSAKPRLHSARALPSVTLGKGHSAAILSAKTSLPNAFCQALGKGFAECFSLPSAKKSEKIKKRNRKKIIGGGMHSQLLTLLMGCTFFSNFPKVVDDRFRTHDLLHTNNSLYHCTIGTSVSTLHFYFPHIIINRV